MNLWPFTRRETASDHARALSAEGHRQQRDKVKAVAQRIRRECGLPPSPALDS